MDAQEQDKKITDAATEALALLQKHGGTMDAEDAKAEFTALFSKYKEHGISPDAILAAISRMRPEGQA